MKRLVALALGVVAFGACGDGGVSAPPLDPSFDRRSSAAGPRGITVLTRNG